LKSALKKSHSNPETISINRVLGYVDASYHLADDHDPDELNAARRVAEAIARKEYRLDWKGAVVDIGKTSKTAHYAFLPENSCVPNGLTLLRQYDGRVDLMEKGKAAQCTSLGK
jgi:hypothetical protein